MENKLIENWLSTGSGYGSGYSSGYCYGYSSGYGYSYGSGSGDGSGSGSGSGDGYGTGKNISKFNNYDVFIIDSIQTIITSIIKSIASGYILNSDLTLEKTFIAKGNGYFAHGKTVKKAVASLEQKIFKNIGVEEKIKIFIKRFNNKDKYSGNLFFEWHNKLTSSCLQGRDNFVKQNEIDIKKKYTVKEFIKICENSYGGDIIKQLYKFYK